MSVSPGRLLSKSLFPLLLAPLGFAAFGSAQAANTYYVRTDGGDASQCTGRADAAYSGSGTGQACAWKHPFFALTPGGARRIAGGDTLLIGGGNYMMGQGAAGAGSCKTSSCFMPSIPSGPSATAKTRILGKPGATPRLWGTGGASKILNLEGSSNVEVGNLEVTDQHDCVYNHSNAAANCPSPGAAAWAKTGLSAKASRNVWLHDLNIHGMSSQGVLAGGLTDWTVDRVKIIANGRVGWTGNVGTTGSSNSGAIILRNVEIGFNGCGERWQSGEPWACWAQQTGGYGDGLGTYYTGGQWLIEDSFIHHNTSDGLDLRYMDGADGTKVTVRRAYLKANAGNQAKIRGNSLVENSVIISECGYFEGKFYMIKADNCRAAGNALQLVMTANDVATVRHNTITGESGSLLGTGEGDASARVSYQNNILIGLPQWIDPSRQASLLTANSPAPVSWSGNLIWNVKSNTCPAGSICDQNPKLANMSLAGFDAELLAGSPAVDKVPMMSSVNSDFVLQPRPSGSSSDIGAYELQAGGNTSPPPAPEPTPTPTPAPTPAPSPTCTRATPSLGLSGPTVAVAASTTSSYTLVMRNNDSSACSNKTFSLARTVPNGWTSTMSLTSVKLAPGATATSMISVKSTTATTAGSYNIGAGVSSGFGSVHTNSASATYTVAAAAAPVAALTETIATSKSVYIAGQTVSMTARVLNNGKPVQGARVLFDALKPNGVNHNKQTASTDSNGYARASFTSDSGPSSIGTYKLAATATSGSLTKVANMTFVVKK